MSRPNLRIQPSRYIHGSKGELVSRNGNTFRGFAVCQVGVSQRAEAVDFLVDELVSVERLGTTGKPHGAQPSGQHGGIIPRTA